MLVGVIGGPRRAFGRSPGALGGHLTLFDKYVKKCKTWIKDVLKPSKSDLYYFLWFYKCCSRAIMRLSLFHAAKVHFS